MTRPDDSRLEHAVREALRRQDPGPAPLALRERALRVPDVTHRRHDARRQVLSGVLGLAAVVVVAVVALGVGGQMGRPSPASSSLAVATAVASGVPAPAGSTIANQATAPATAEATPFATASPIPATPGPSATPIAFATTQPGAGPSFDPNLEGPGITAHVDDGNAVRGLLIMTAVVLAFVALAIRGWRRLIPAAGAAALVAWVLVATLVSLELGTNGYGPGLYTAMADQPLGYTETVIYVFAPAGGHYSIGVWTAGGDVLLPARLEAIEAPYARQDPYNGMTWTAVWLDREVNGGSSGPVDPFTPMDLPLDRSLWLVGRAASCANGPTFDPRRSESTLASLDTSLVLQVSVLGIPRRVELPLGLSVVEPVGEQCPDPAPTSSPSPAGSAGP